MINNQLLTPIYIGKMKIFILILIFSINCFGQETIFDNHIGGNFQIDYIKNAGYKNPLLKYEGELAKRYKDFTTILNVGRFFRYNKTHYESAHYYSAKLTERYNYKSYFLGAGLEYTRAKVQIDQNIWRESILAGKKINDYLETYCEYQFPDQSLYKLSSVHWGVNFYTEINKNWYLQIKEAPFMFFTNRDKLGRVGNDFSVGITYGIR